MHWRHQQTADVAICGGSKIILTLLHRRFAVMIICTEQLHSLPRFSWMRGQQLTILLREQQEWFIFTFLKTSPQKYTTQPAARFHFPVIRFQIKSDGPRKCCCIPITTIQKLLQSATVDPKVQRRLFLFFLICSLRNSSIVKMWLL